MQTLLSTAALAALIPTVLVACAAPGADAPVEVRADLHAAVPVDPVEFAAMAEAALLGPDDIAALRRSRAILVPRSEEILDVWYGFVGSKPQLLASFANAAGEPQGDYLAAVRVRFGQWIDATCAAEYDADWLAQQHEVGLRHHRAKKNRTDGADAAAIVPFRYLLPLTVPIVHTLRPFLAADGASDEEVDAMQEAWLKSVILQVTLWSRPYVIDGDF